MNKKIGQYILRLIGMLIGLVLVYYLLLCLAYLVPDSAIAENHGESIRALSQEERRWEVMPGIAGTRLDNFTDRLIFEKMVNSENLPFYQAALSNEGYTRYWIGSVAVVRLLLVAMGYRGIRYLNLFVLTFLTFATVYLLDKKLGHRHSLTFILALLMMHAWIIPLSLQYSPVHYITLISIILILLNYEKMNHWSHWGLFFTLIGSLTNYFDLLTAPLLTFGLPFLVAYLLAQKLEERNFYSNLLLFINTGIHWLVGYTLTWFAKWTLGTLVLGENVFANAFNSIGVRTTGFEGEILSLEEILSDVLAIAFPKYFWMILVLFILGLLIYGQTTKERLGWPNFQTITKHLPLLIVAVLPFVWVAILKNHTYHHDYYTYRQFAITLFGILTYLNLIFVSEEVS